MRFSIRSLLILTALVAMAVAYSSGLYRYGYNGGYDWHQKYCSDLPAADARSFAASRGLAAVVMGWIGVCAVGMITMIACMGYYTKRQRRLRDARQRRHRHRMDRIQRHSDLRQAQHEVRMMQIRRGVY